MTAVSLNHILVGQELSDVEQLIDHSLVLAASLFFRFCLRCCLGLALWSVNVLHLALYLPAGLRSLLVPLLLLLEPA